MMELEPVVQDDPPIGIMNLFSVCGAERNVLLLADERLLFKTGCELNLDYIL